MNFLFIFNIGKKIKQLHSHKAEKNNVYQTDMHRQIIVFILHFSFNFLTLITSLSFFCWNLEEQKGV